VRTLGEVLATYGQRPEHKSLAPDGSPAGSTTVGLLRRRPVRSSPARTHLAGKEGNKLLERLTGVERDPAGYRTDYGSRADPWAGLVVPVLRRMGASEVAQRASPGWRRSIERIIEDGHQPKSRDREAILTEVAVEHAREHIGGGTHPDTAAALAAYLDRLDGPAVTLCACGCGLPARSARARWYSDAHRKRATRRS
jgi:hypothetical protein